MIQALLGVQLPPMGKFIWGKPSLLGLSRKLDPMTTDSTQESSFDGKFIFLPGYLPRSKKAKLKRRRGGPLLDTDASWTWEWAWT
jgi:hypothetical protein